MNVPLTYGDNSTKLFYRRRSMDEMTEMFLRQFFPQLLNGIRGHLSSNRLDLL